MDDDSNLKRKFKLVKSEISQVPKQHNTFLLHSQTEDSVDLSADDSNVITIEEGLKSDIAPLNYWQDAIQQLSTTLSSNNNTGPSLSFLFTDMNTDSGSHLPKTLEDTGSPSTSSYANSPIKEPLHNPPNNNEIDYSSELVAVTHLDHPEGKALSLLLK